MSDYIITDGGELCHYGVIGMKWGVRRGRAGEAYQKASKKLIKLDDKVNKQFDKSMKVANKTNKKLSSRFASDDEKQRAILKAKESQSRLDGKIHKARKWYSSMEKTFKDTDIKMSKEQIALGKKYKQQLETRTMFKYMGMY